MDIWSLGITAIELATMLPPWAGASMVQVIANVVEGEPPTARGGSAALRAFLAAALVKDPGARPAAGELLSHPFLQGPDVSRHGQRALQQLLQTHLPSAGPGSVPESLGLL